MSMYASGRLWFRKKRKPRAAGKPTGAFKPSSAREVAYLSEKRTDHTPSYEGGPSEAEERGASDGANDLPGLHGDEALPPLAVRTYAGSGDHD